jgi:glutamate-1-semialdehyde 2,1-aminomutase
MNYTNSLKYLERAKKVIPGAAQTLSKMPARFPQGAFPVAVSYGDGAQVADVDRNRYVDWVGALGAVPLGYNNSRVYYAVKEQLEYGASFSLPHVGESALAERLCEKIPCAEMVRFVNSGSEATEAAIRTARIATGRDLILTVKEGYHSWHSWFQAVKDWHPGVPDAYRLMIGGFKYNDLASLEQAFGKSIWAFAKSSGSCNGKVAAVIMEPCLFEKPEPGFLEGVRELCTKHGALLIFDEMVTGYRWALAGGQEYFNVTPDLATYGKGMANGLPIGMLCGKREYMQHAELISGTFGGNAVSLAAANAVLDVYESEPVIETMWKRGEELQHFFNYRAPWFAVEALCDGYPCKPRIKFIKETEKSMSLFLQVTAENGILLHPGGLNCCYALTDNDMKVTFSGIDQGLCAVREAQLHDDWSALKGDLIKPVVTVRQ